MKNNEDSTVSFFNERAVKKAWSNIYCLQVLYPTLKNSLSRQSVVSFDELDTYST